MAKYTTEVRSICEVYAGLDESVGYDSIDDVISKAREKVFDFNYPIFDEAYRSVLETKILEHYYTREICEETVGLWKLRLKTKMNEIMPYYNQLYESELLEFNPLYDVDYKRQGTKDGKEDNTRTDDLNRTSRDSGKDTRTISREEGGQDVTTGNIENGGRDTVSKTSTDSGTDRRTGNTTDSGSQGTSDTRREKFSEWNLYSDTPQGGIEGIQGAEDEPDLVDNGYLTNARHILHDGDGTTGSSTTTFGKIVNATDNTTYGKVNNTQETDTFGKTTDTEESTSYGKTEDVSDETAYGRVNSTDDTGTVKFNGTTNAEYAEHVFGKMTGKSYAQLLQEFRDTFLNIDLEIIKELKPLFFNLW